jgi:hypothetical protein
MNHDDLHELMPLGPHKVAGLFRALLPADVAELRLPAERFADCASCPPAERGTYHPSSRCCAHLPHVPNLGLGLALEDPSAGPTVRAVIQGGFALPSGLWSPPARLKATAAVDAAGRFGTDPAMTCPLLNPSDMTCGVYAYRNAVCSTFFCVNDHGADGTELWSTLQAFLGNAELRAAHWAMGEAGLSWETQVSRMAELSVDLDSLSAAAGGWTKEALRILWGDWYGREEAFYSDCVSALRTHRADLPELLAVTPLTDAVAFEVAVRDWIPEAHRDMVAPIAEEGLEHVPAPDLWYSLQLEARNLWALPFGEPLSWADGVVVRSPDGRLPLLLGGRHEVLLQKKPYWLTDEELTLYVLFQPGRVLDSALLDSPEADAAGDVRALLSELLRRGLLVPTAQSRL